MTFDRGSLTSAASLNELVVAIAPYAGRRGADLLSRDAIAELAPRGDPRRLADGLADDPTTAGEVGRRLAALLATLRRGPQHDAEAAERRRSLEEWTRIDDVVLGGGLLSGRFGSDVVDAARRAIAELDAPETELSLAPNAAHLGLIGAARSTSLTDGSFLALDAGQTTVKRGRVDVAGGTVRRLRLLPSLPFEWDGDVVDLLHRALDGTTADHEPVPCSVATYVRDGRPIVQHGSPYEALAGASAELTDRLALVHDGTAAWRGTGRTTSSAVIVLGTFLGVGMGPQPTAPPLRPLADDFEVVPEA